MNLAITLLVAIAIAAVIGTVIQQNQPYPDYLLKFGPFWFELFKTLDLFNVYGSVWFLSILGFLVLSTSVCVSRHVPRILQDVNDYRENAQRAALAKLPHCFDYKTPGDADQTEAIVLAVLRNSHYSLRRNESERAIVIAAKKGSAGRLGYLFSHIAIIVICVGGLIDGNLPLKVAEWLGRIAVETRRIPVSEIPSISTLDESNLSFRANIDIAEGRRSNVAFVDYKDGYLLQKLPFALQVDDFRIEHYASGQPKTFESDLVVIDDDLPQPLKQTISVNHPLSYKGYTVYQNSFGDGGSKLALTAWPLTTAKTAFSVETTVKRHADLEGFSLEVGDFRPFNVNPDVRSVKKFVNMGPSFQYKLRRADGTANEYLTYMQPVEQDGRLFYLSGMRSKIAEPFVYWFIPADDQKRLDRFMTFNRMLHDAAVLNRVAQTTARTGTSGQQSNDDNRQAVAGFLKSLVEQFVAGGNKGLASTIEKTVAEDKRQSVFALYEAGLQRVLAQVYREVLRQEGGTAEKDLSAFDS